MTTTDFYTYLQPFPYTTLFRSARPLEHRDLARGQRQPEVMRGIVLGAQDDPGGMVAGGTVRADLGGVDALDRHARTIEQAHLLALPRRHRRRFRHAIELEIAQLFLKIGRAHV